MQQKQIAKGLRCSSSALKRNRNDFKKDQSSKKQWNQKTPKATKKRVIDYAKHCTNKKRKLKSGRLVDTPSHRSVLIEQAFSNSLTY